MSSSTMRGVKALQEAKATMVVAAATINHEYSSSVSMVASMLWAASVVDIDQSLDTPMEDSKESPQLALLESEDPTGIITKGANNNFITLIPKVDGAMTLDKFHPIYLGNFLYKLISKILASRLSSFLPMIVFEEQGDFQKGKVIFSNIYIVFDLTNSLHKKICGGGIGLKLDIHKAYDTMKGPVGPFGVERGLRQGDPVAPLLFIIVEEVLCRGFSDLKNKGIIKPLHGPRSVSMPSHLLFVDDVFLFMNAGVKYVQNLKSFLDQYKSYLGQKLNSRKSKMFLCNLSSTRKSRIQDVSCFSNSSFPIRYLAVDIVKGKVKKDHSLSLVDKIKSRFSGWKDKPISMAVISNISIDSFSIYWWPTSLISLMERWARNFIWSRDLNQPKRVIVKWDIICKPREKQGPSMQALVVYQDL
ncbi:uncharacterized protein LOC122665616 [Telopea speciosissima]|uniref:uncharacterized protein LOC122665616 n=1 Tax=Telopea speciosissima TaxID=54955 RepID=UPI001CC47CF0|nr:uncharacterized protein LOC122665616 [Telopea speciosissima]